LKNRLWISVALLAGFVGLSAVLLLASHDRRVLVLKFVSRHLTRSTITREDIESYIRANGIQDDHSPMSAAAAGPLRVNPANRRYFMDGHGQVVYLAGSHAWLNLQDGADRGTPRKFDYATWLKFLQSQNHNFFRLWTWEQAKWAVESPDPYYFEPLPYARIENSSEPALDGKPRFDLTKFNQLYFDRLRQRVVEAGQSGIYVSIMLFNGWSVAYPKGASKEKNPWLAHPFNIANNVNGIDGDANASGSGEEIHELRNAKVTAIQEAYVRKVLDTIADLDNVLFEISNESHSGSVAWQYHMIDFIHRYESGKPKQHPVGMTVIFPNGQNDELYASNADWISPKGDLHDRPVADGRKVVVADTDHLCGICGDAKWVWMSFTRGENLLFMDQYDDGYSLKGGGYNLGNRNDLGLRKNLGFARRYAGRMHFVAMQPRGDLASSGYALANPGSEYLVFAPDGGAVIVDLKDASGDFDVEWLDVETGRIIAGATASGGAPRSFTAPTSGGAVLYLVTAKH
jgi:hypothetical protein